MRNHCFANENAATALFRSILCLDVIYSVFVFARPLLMSLLAVVFGDVEARRIAGVEGGYVVSCWVAQ
jgi:hypothetical protein